MSVLVETIFSGRGPSEMLGIDASPISAGMRRLVHGARSLSIDLATNHEARGLIPPIVFYASVPGRKPAKRPLKAFISGIVNRHAPYIIKQRAFCRPQRLVWQHAPMLPEAVIVGPAIASTIMRLVAAFDRAYSRISHVMSPHHRVRAGRGCSLVSGPHFLSESRFVRNNIGGGL